MDPGIEFEPQKSEWWVDESRDNELHWQRVAIRRWQDDAKAILKSMQEKFPTRKYRVREVNILG